MAVLKCKMCGGELTVEEGATVAVCEYCGSRQTVPKADDEKKMKLFDRANRLRFNCEFDKAGEVYENIIGDFPEEAEAYWGNLLCKYGIEYVDDPATGDKIPTCHRSSFDSFMDDPDFEMVMENSDSLSRAVYREQAKQIEEIRKGIIEVSGKEEPYDIFICYKETAEDGQRTIDSVIAQDVYDALTAKGYRVFFSRISLEDKLGTEYEPYIFAALNSAKVMLAFGTSYDYYNAVWVKNEWSRFLKLMAKDKEKALIPCYKDIDAYDMPKEFAKLQAQDMGKVGAVQDLLRGIDKLTGKGQKDIADKTNVSQNQTVIQQVVPGGTNADALLKRGFMSLEDGAFDEAKKYFDDSLNCNAECGEAYLGLFMAGLKAKDKNAASDRFVKGDYQNDRYWQRAKQFAEGNLLEELKVWETKRQERLTAEEDQRKEAERQKREAEENFRKEKEEFLKQYQNGTLQYPEEMQKKYDPLKAEADRLKEEADMLSKDADTLERESRDAQERGAFMEISNRLAEREKYLSSLGIFKGKEKKEVQAEIDSLREQEQVYQEKIKEKEKKAEKAKEAFLDMKKKSDHAKQQAEAVVSGFIVKRQLKYGLTKTKKIDFGSYDQGKGKQPIEWIILEVRENKALLLSRYALEARTYNKEYVVTTWEKCTLRSWLNGEFYTTAFNAEEQKCIIESTVSADRNPIYNTNPGNNTKDKLFLLSIPEVNKYFTNNEERKCAPTEYAKAQGTYTNHDYKVGGKATCWWLRSPGNYGISAAYVDLGGSVGDRGFRVNYDESYVRPALWIDLES